VTSQDLTVQRIDFTIAVHIRRNLIEIIISIPIRQVPRQALAIQGINFIVFVYVAVFGSSCLRRSHA
jgi:hypothetical protein